MLVVNMQTVSGLRFLGAEELAALQAPLDRALDLMLRVLVEGKALAAFSLLFGFSFWMLIGSAARRGAAFLGFFYRRLLVLGLIGLLNAAAFYWGDILTTYAALGAFLPLAARLSQTAVLRLAMALLLVPPLVLALAGVASPALPPGGERASLAAFAADGLARTLEHNWALYSGAVGAADGLRLWRYTTIGGLFLLGLLVGRAGVVFRIEVFRRGLARLAAVALGLGLPMEAASATGLVDGPLRTALLVAKPLTAVGYLALAAVLLDGARAAWLRGGLAPLGRMALTGYLMGGLLGQVVFHGWGLGLIGRSGSAAVLAWSGLIVLVLAVAARLWLGWFLYGPWEWLWRWLSRLERPPMRAS